MSLASLEHDDYANLNAKGAAVVWLGNGPKLEGVDVRRLLGSRARTAFDRGAIATVSPVAALAAAVAVVEHRRPKAPSANYARRKRRPANSGQGQGQGAGRGQGQGQGFGRGAADDGDFTTVQRLDNKVPPAVTAQDEFFEFLFSASEVKYAELKAEGREAGGAAAHSR